MDSHDDSTEALGTNFSDEPDEEHAPAVLRALSDRVVAQDKRVRPKGLPDRAQHMKAVLGAFGVVQIGMDIPAPARQGPFAVAGEFKAAIRFSNGQPIAFHDRIPDVRGIAVKFFPTPDDETDLLVTNEGGRSHARTAKQFVDVADVLADLDEGLAGFTSAAKDLMHSKIGLKEGLHVIDILTRATIRPVKSLALESYWGSVLKLGGAAIKYSLQPSSSAGADIVNRGERDYLRDDLLDRLSNGPVRFRLCIQFFVDEERTPVKDASVVWQADQVEIGAVEIRKAPTEQEEKIVNSMAFNPGNGFAPLGITHARNDAYAASARNRGAMSSQEVRRFFA